MLDKRLNSSRLRFKKPGGANSRRVHCILSAMLYIERGGGMELRYR